MNWLAHLFLSQPDGAYRLGNLFGDLVKLKDRKNLDTCFDRGLECHLLIDYFTDRHEIFRRSKRRISYKGKKYSGVLIDVFYDHFLAINWHIYSSKKLPDFTKDVYDSFIEYWDLIPVFPQIIISKMIEQDWLDSYSCFYGVEATLKRIKGKIPHKYRDSFEVNSFLEQLEKNYELLDGDFQEFFPEIISYIDEKNNVMLTQ